MSDELTTKKRRNTLDSPAKRVTPEDDHRRKRRNRTTQSCLNCHTSKRMCDRKRPCGRCTQLGLTGLCVYEVDDPSRKASSSDSFDEKDRLQKRVAELESVIRELKNKPHPRWVAGSNVDKNAMDTDQPNSSSTTAKNSRSMPSSPKSAKHDSTFAVDNGSSGSNSAHFVHTSTSSHSSSRSSPFLGGRSTGPPSSPSVACSSPVNTPSPLCLSPIEAQASMGSGSDYDLSSMFSTDKLGLDDGLFSDIWDRLIRPDSICSTSPSGEHCGCLHDPANYNVVLELSIRLRKAADTLGRSTNHCAGTSSCAINQNIAELDRFTSNALGNISAPPEAFASYPMRDRAVAPAVPTTNPTLPYNTYVATRPNPPATAPTISPASQQSIRPWDYKLASYPSPPWEDSFMSWMPQRR